ncbi:type IV conjugative transfer system coupling protein TraD [Motilimonas pumila]|uniref:Conjugative coupling factor TraD, PFGI-1 class n=1 Tax=Motilimonas pumila TaxID=2303987 RepID=A0A418YA43_9GAMM|nr:type IV conjugative transfer system coupling protein TraD [Motilimonas pumila]RJG38975.1 conjugative coupling factor TraD, PFGI-1 class [Motilimonas pumila]
MANQDYPLEAMLRPPVELYSSLCAGAAASLCFMAPHTILMSPQVGYGCSAVLASFACYRLQQAHQVLRYQRNLKRLSAFTITTNRIPASSRRLWLGQGFEWRQKHTQRLWDCKTVHAEQYIRPSRGYCLAREIERRAERQPWWQPLAYLTHLDTRLNPFRPLPPLGGSTILHGVELREHDQTLELENRSGHVCVYGTTRCGKSRLAEILISQDIIRGDGCVVCIDPKGDAGILKRMYAQAKACGKEDEFYVLHLGFPDISARYNGVGQFSRISEVASRISNQLAAEGNSAAFKEFAWRFINIVARALVELGKKPCYELILKYILDIEPLFIDYAEIYLARQGAKAQGWQAVISNKERSMKSVPPNMRGRAKRTCALEIYFSEQDIFDPVINGLRSAVRYDKTYFDKLTASLLPLLEKLTSGRLAELISPDYLDLNDERPIIDWLSIIRKKSIVYIGLDAMTDGDVAQGFGNSMFADLVSTAGYLYKHGVEEGLYGGEDNKLPKVYLHAEEFNELSGDEFVPLLNKGGAAGIDVVAYTQTKSDVEARMGNLAKAKQIEGNFNTIIMMRVKSAETAEILTSQLPTVSINQSTQVSGVNDSSTPGDSVHFTSRNEDRISTINVPMLEPSNIINLPKGQAFALVEGGRLLKLRFPLLKEVDTQLPESLKTMTTAMAANYKTSEGWWNDLVSSAQHYDPFAQHQTEPAHSSTDESQNEAETESVDFEALFEQNALHVNQEGEPE